MEDLLESIVGNIQDEFDHEEEEVTTLGDNTFDVDGSIDMEELGELLGRKLPEGDYDTLGGYIMDELGRIPGEDEQPAVTYENVTFTVLKMDDPADRPGTHRGHAAPGGARTGGTLRPGKAEPGQQGQREGQGCGLLTAPA